MEQEEELGGNYLIIITKKIKGCSQRYGNNKG